jgi:hypothetical protein
VEADASNVRELAKGFEPSVVPDSPVPDNPVVEFVSLVTKIPEGRYAAILPGEDHLRFFKFDKPQTGKWAGYTFVKEQAGDTDHSVRSASRRLIIAGAIAEDPMEAMLTYGREIGRCGHCGRTLTDEDSRAAGIGPVCRRKLSF